jgi:hypothetical protein
MVPPEEPRQYVAKGDQINLRPHFKKDGPTLPCEGEVGDLYVFTPLDEGDRDPTPQGQASLWFCVKTEDGEGPAIWKRVAFDDKTTCKVVPAMPPQNTPELKEG